MTGDPGSGLREFARAVYGGCSGFVEVASFVAGQAKRSRHIPVELFLDSADAILELADEGIDVFLGCVTTSERPEKGRGRTPIRLDVPGVWLDLDLAVDGHHATRSDGLRRLRDLDETQELLGRTGLPEPTALLHSGGGLYAWWLFHEPLVLQDDDLDHAGALRLVIAVNELVAGLAAEQQVGVDRVGDLVRVLRPPGTTNWKRGALNPKPVRLLYLDEELRVSAADLAERVEDVVVTHRSGPTTVSNRSTGAPNGQGSIADLCRTATWEEILFPVGWTYGAPVSGGTSFLRPGRGERTGSKPGDGYGGSSGGGDDGAKSAVVYDDGPAVLVVFSDACGLPMGIGQNLTKFKVMSYLWFGGSMSACARDLNDAVKHYAFDENVGASRVPWPESILKAGSELVRNPFVDRRRVRTWQR